MLKTSRCGPWYWGVVSLSAWNVSLLVGCERAPREPESRPSAAPATSNQEDSEDDEENGIGGSKIDAAEASRDACVVPLLEPPPPQAQSVEDCPEDPEGRPTMPIGTIRFPEAPGAPTLKVERAMTDPHRTHGLMFRPELSDDEGMLFSWSQEGRRAFWMRNTCLALDMLFIDQDGMISGIIEQVPPMNETSRRINCLSAHVLEVRAGWTRAYGVRPGQKLIVDGDQ
jgi:uncharacterized membrane protein (UPF0127 family)